MYQVKFTKTALNN